MIGLKIKELRSANGMTQKDLADKLYVTAQAVSRWENGEVEPSISTIGEIAKIFNVSSDELLGINSDKKENVEQVTTREVVVEKAPPQVLAVCERCNNPIYRPEDIKRFTHYSYSGRTRVEKKEVLCPACNDKRLKAEKAALEYQKQENIKDGKKRRIRSFVWGGLYLALCLIIGLSSEEYTLDFIIGGIGGFFFISCLFFNNNFISDVFLKICSWGFVKMPGLIFSLSIDGLIWLLTVKLALWILSLALSVFCFILALAICFILSVFVYPFALANNIKHPEDTN